MHPIWTQDSTTLGATDSAIAEWNTRQKRELPAVLAALLRQHDGGRLKQFFTNWDLSPLADIKPVNTRYLEDVWQMHETMEEWKEELKENGIPPRTKLYPFLREGNEFYWLAWLDDRKEPRIIQRHWDDDGFHVREQSVDEWCIRNLAPVPSEKPGVAWEESRELEVIFEEKCILGTWVKGEQVLGRKDGGLWLYTHDIWERNGALELESYTKKRIPEPLDQSKCATTKEVANWCLPLKPAGAGGCEEWESRRNDDSGGWIDTLTKDIGTRRVYSPDREKIEAVRLQLFGAKAVVKADRKAWRESQMWAGHNAMAEKLQAGLEKVYSIPGDDPARGELLQALHKQMMEAVTVSAGTMERMVMRLIPPVGEAADLLAAIQQYCREHGIDEPPGLATRAAKPHAVVRRDQGAPGLVAVTWKTLNEAAAYLKKNPPADAADEAVEILDFSKRNRYGWSSEGPVLSGDF